MNMIYEDSDSADTEIESTSGRNDRKGSCCLTYAIIAVLVVLAIGYAVYTWLQHYPS